jgi:hypothetical protein
MTTSDLEPEDFGLVKEDLEERAKRFVKQRAERGWDDSETWSLFTTFCCWIVPRLKRYKELSGGYPPSMSEDEWCALLDKMIEGFEICARDDDPMSYENVKVREALQVFHDYFFQLWW